VGSGRARGGRVAACCGVVCGILHAAAEHTDLAIWQIGSSGVLSSMYLAGAPAPLTRHACEGRGRDAASLTRALSALPLPLPLLVYAFFLSPMYCRACR